MKDMLLNRTLTIERGSVDGEGRFPMILASEGEAADGHILSIRGLEVSERMPMLFNHQSTLEIPSLGSITNPTPSVDTDGVPILRAVGVFNTTGDDALAETRRGIQQLVSDGDLPSMSLRFKGTGTARSSLAKGHPHRVERGATDAARHGVFIDKSLGMEGSVCAIGVDPRALSGRADATTDSIARTFFRTLAEEPQVHGMTSLGNALRLVQDASDEFVSAGVGANDVVRLLGADPDEELVSIAVDGTPHLIPRCVYKHLMQRASERLRELVEMSERSDAPVEPVVHRDVPAIPALQSVPNTINSMSVRSFEEMLRGALTDAVYRKTGRRM